MSARTNAEKAKELYDLKNKAKDYYEQNGVTKKMEQILNNMFFDNPDDVYGHLANYFESFAVTPTMSKIDCRVVYDSKAQQTLQLDIFCMIKNFEKLIVTSTSNNENYPPETSKPEDIEAAVIARKASIEKAQEFIKQYMSPAFLNIDPRKQEELDNILLNIYGKLKEEEEVRLAKEKEEGGEEDEQVASGRNTAVTPSKGRKSAGKKGGKGPAVVVVPDEPREVLLSGCSFVTTASQAVCQAGAVLAELPLYQHIANCATGGQAPDEYRLPLPMVTILAGGRLWPGKQNCVKEFMIVPRATMSPTEYMRHVTEIYQYCAKSISSKSGDKRAKSPSKSPSTDAIVNRNVNEFGALTPAYDRVEQGLDLLQEAITQQGLVPGEDFSLALNLHGQECFDYDKGKYEVITGIQKLTEDMAEFYTDLVTRYPAIMCIIDPVRKEEKESWMKLCERVTAEQCLVAGETVYPRPGLLKDQEISTDFQSSATVLNMENITTVMDACAAAKHMADNSNELIFSAQTADNTETFIVDLAVACGARFLKLGAPCRGERIAKYNRLLQLEDELRRKGQVGMWEEIVYPIVKPPTPPPEEVTEEGSAGEGGQQDKKTPSSSARSDKK